MPEGGRLPEAVLRRLVAPGSVLFSAPQIAHFVMAITAASTIVRHTTLLGQLERPQFAVELRRENSDARN